MPLKVRPEPISSFACAIATALFGLIWFRPAATYVLATEAVNFDQSPVLNARAVLPVKVIAPPVALYKVLKSAELIGAAKVTLTLVTPALAGINT